MKKLALVTVSTFVILTANALPSSASSLDKFDVLAPTTINTNLTKLEADDLISTQVESKPAVIIIKIEHDPKDPYVYFPPYQYYNSGGYSGYLPLASYSFDDDKKYHVVYRGTVYKSGTIPVPSQIKDEE